jgi:hypothetical protein
MSNPTKTEISPDFTIVSVDGAYIHVLSGGVRLQFYRDKSFPTHDSYGIPTFRDKEREILHEVRMTVDNANHFAVFLKKGIEAYEREVEEANGLSLLREATQHLIDDVYATREQKAKPIFDKVLSMMEHVNEFGQTRIIKLLDKIIEENAPRFEEIFTTHAAKVEGK